MIEAPVFTWAEYDADPSAVRDRFNEVDTARHAARMQARVEYQARFAPYTNYEMASFESFCNFGVVFAREFYPVWW